jgi:C-terminal processing protease CtpA/Prc
VLQLGVQVGDVLVAVDGTPVEQRRQFLASLFSLSSPQARKWRTDMKLLAGPEGSSAKLTLQRPISRVLDVSAEGSAAKAHAPQYAEYTLEVPRTMTAQLTIPRSGPVFHILEVCDAQQKKIAYLDLTRLAVSDVDTALEHILIPSVGAIVMDLRGHTRGSIFRLAPHFASHTTRVASTQVPVLLPSLLVGHVHESMLLTGQQHCIPSIPISHSHSSLSPHLSLLQSIKIIALINEETMSHGEYAATVLKAVRPDTIFFGAQSTGSLGSLTNLPLPGGILVGFTAMGITKPDGSEIQSRGITPDHIVQEHPESILLGRDDIMEAALAFLKS